MGMCEPGGELTRKLFLFETEERKQEIWSGNRLDFQR